jgi:hypothetical protein
VLPDLLSDLAESDKAADESVRSSAASWTAATVVEHADTGTSGESGGAHLRPVEDLATPPPTGGPTSLPAPGPAPEPRPAQPRLLRPGFAPPTDPTGRAAVGPQPATGAPRRRLLGGPRTVLKDGAAGTASSPPPVPRPPLPGSADGW